MKNSLSPQKALAGLLSVLVLVVVVGGISLAGSPAKVRREQLDQQRINALQQIATAVDTMHAADGMLPASLDELAARAKSKNDIYLGTTTDPVTQATYDYHVTGDAAYELCATFDAPTPEDRDGMGNPKQPMPVGYPGYRSWEHAAGHACFELDATAQMPTVACSLTNPCVAPNTTCTQLPNRGTYCVPQGKECLAAGCDEAFCTVAESYPVQVRCTDAGSGPGPGNDSDEPVSTEPARPITCNLMKSKESGAMACYGCGSQICQKPGPEWEMYTQPEGSMGIPYSCYDGPNGACALAQ